MTITVAIDGPAASGKGTLARQLAASLGVPHLDTGLLYRAVGRRVLDRGENPADGVAATASARALVREDLARDDLRGPVADAAAAAVASEPGVRAALLDFQRGFAAQAGGAVLDGRDIGTVVCPDADIKLYVTASAEVRAKRRLAEIESIGGTASYSEILADIARRDERDMGRVDSPLKPAPDAHLLDTSEMAIEAAFLAAMAIVDDVLARRNKA